jgi:hypothetical protein
MRLNPRALWRYRPRFLTLLLFLIVAGVLVLSNAAYVSMFGAYRRTGEWVYESYSGWPLVWYRKVIKDFGSPKGLTVWQVRPGRLAGDVALWSIMLGAAVGGCEWLLRRYRPRFRWSLRTMLIAVAITATICGWFVRARHRANEQDPLIASLHRVRLTRWGPRWLDLLGADRFRRQVVGAHVYAHSSEAGEQILNRLARLPALQSLYFRIGELTPPMVDALREMPQLRILGIDNGGERLSDECLNTIGNLRQLEYLRLENMKLAADDFASLTDLTSLKSISLEFVSVDRAPVLRGLPQLPQVQTVYVSYSDVGNADLRYLVELPHLKRLDLHGTHVTDIGMQGLGHLQSLEEIGIDDEMVTERGLTTLLALERLA